MILTLDQFSNATTDLGLSQILIRETAQRPSADLAVTVRRLRTGYGALSGAIAIGVALVLIHGASGEFGAVVVLATCPLAGLTTGMATLQAGRRFQAFSAFSLLQSMAVLLAAAVIEVFHANLVETCVLLSIAGFIWAGPVAVTTLGSFRGGRFRMSLARRLMGEGAVIGLAATITFAYHRIDYFIVYALSPKTAAGYYAAAYRVFDQSLLIPTALVSVLFPYLVSRRRGTRRSSEIRHVYLQTPVVVASFLALTLGVGASVVVRACFGTAYAASAEELTVLAVSLVPCTVYAELFQVAVMHSNLRGIIVSAGGALAVNLLANAIFIPRYGPIAAAWVTVATESIASATIAFYERDWIARAVTPLWLLRYAVSIATALVPLQFVYAGWAKMLACAGVYCGCVLVLDVAPLRRLLARTMLSSLRTAIARG